MEKRLKFSKKEVLGMIFIKNDKDEVLGRLEKERIGKWMSWCLFLDSSCYLSAGCLDEVREKIKELNATLSKKKDI